MTDEKIEQRHPGQDECDTNLMAFWEYDQYPYLLGGCITRISSTGYVSVRGYAGSVFKPLYVLPADPDGRNLLNILEALQAGYSKRKSELKLEFLRYRDATVEKCLTELVFRAPHALVTDRAVPATPVSSPPAYNRMPKWMAEEHAKRAPGEGFVEFVPSAPTHPEPPSNEKGHNGQVVKQPPGDE